VEGWEAVQEHHITKTFTFPDFRKGLDFVNRIGRVAEEQGHHPDICLGWGRVEVKGQDLDAQDRWSDGERFHLGGED
jgi:4a-hydroxytetrahydrobiopterin dehydratase